MITPTPLHPAGDTSLKIFGLAGRDHFRRAQDPGLASHHGPRGLKARGSLKMGVAVVLVMLPELDVRYRWLKFWLSPLPLSAGYSWLPTAAIIPGPF